jgi:hypothetical protein
MRKVDAIGVDGTGVGPGYKRTSPDLRMSTYDIWKHASWTKEWLVLGLPKEEQRRSHGAGGRANDAAVVQMPLPMAESKR